jgi:hypothetical protein
MMRWALGVAVAGAVFAAACAPDAPSDTLTNGQEPAITITDPNAEAAAGATKWDDARALAWLEKECASCHGVDAKTGTKAPYHSAWPLTAEGITRSFLEVNEFTPVAYQTLRHAALKVGAAPAPMPPRAPDEAKLVELRAMIEWFQRAVPYAVIDADARYGNDSSANEKVLLQFTCKKPSTLRAFLSRVTFGAFERPPTTTELAWFSEQELSAPVTPQARQLIVSKLDGEWRKELMDIGLRKLATVIGGAPGIRANGEITAAIADDLREELYQSFVAGYDTKEYAEYFTSNTVLATPRTAPLYGCTVDTGWKACELKAPRGGFFTTLGFLNSRPQSFLVESNNHGRVASLYFTLYGEQLLAATDGPTGDATPALPTCLEATDTRAYQGAPRGSAAVPQFGKVCQSCHVSRHMAAGSMLFRPFSTTGGIYTADTLGAANTPDAALVTAATDATWTHRDSATATPVRVDRAFLSALLAAPTRPCIATGKPSNPYVDVGSVNELATQLIANRSSFARGFMRHSHRAFANLTTITLEMGLRALTSFDEGKKKLPDLIKAYFGSDTLACEAER